MIGAGGHGREVAEIVAHGSEISNGPPVLGFIDENPALQDSRINGLPVFGNWSWFDSVDRKTVGVICAVGRPELCRRLVERAIRLELGFVNAISPLARVSQSARIGKGVTVFPNVVVSTGADIGDHAILNVAATVSHDSKLGSYVNINPGAHLAGNVEIGEGCYIGMGVNVIQGCTIGAFTVVGAGSTVIRDLPAHVTAVGVPAVIIKKHE